MTIDLDALEALARKATKGPWEGRRFNGRDYIMSAHVRHPNANGTTLHDIAYLCGSNGCLEDDRDFIAACDPQTILELIERARK
jgi:hypothetical protein